MAESLLIYLFQSSIAMAVSVSIILFIRKVFHKALTAETCRLLWLLLPVLAAAPFLMRAFPWLEGLLSSITPLQTAPFNSSWQTTDFGAVSPVFGLLNDFSISVNRNVPSFLTRFVIIIWICGASVLTILTLFSSIKVNHLKATAQPVCDEILLNTFTSCKKQLGIRKEIPLRYVSTLRSPVTAGILAPCVLLPAPQIIGLSDNEIRCILLHELQHYKRRDIVYGLLFRLLFILYWFHPMVWLAVKEMESDREIACDAAVLSVLGDDGFLDYGNALLHYAAGLSHLPFGQTAGIGSSKKEIQKRIAHIAAHRQYSIIRRIKSMLLFLLAAVLVAFTVPPVSSLAFSPNRYDEMIPQIIQEDLSRFFGDIEGSFVLYDMQKDQYLLYGEDDARTRVSPDSTYKIYSALMALDAGIISQTDSHMAWNGEIQPFDSWNRDQTLNSAMADSVNWYFVNLDHSQGVETVRRYLTELSYGNLDFSGGLSRYWLESSLKISPLEQIKLLSGLCKNTLPFTKQDMATVKNSLLISSDATVSLYGKTGTGTIEGKNTNGWFTGFVEAKGFVYVFAVHIQGENGASGTRAAEIALRILKEKNYAP